MKKYSYRIIIIILLAIITWCDISSCLNIQSIKDYVWDIKLDVQSIKILN